MTIYERLDDATRKALGAREPVVHRPKRQNNSKNVKYTEHELRELMGVNRDTYKRSNGRVKRK